MLTAYRFQSNYSGIKMSPCRFTSNGRYNEVAFFAKVIARHNFHSFTCCDTGRQNAVTQFHCHWTGRSGVHVPTSIQLFFYQNCVPRSCVSFYTGLPISYDFFCYKKCLGREPVNNGLLETVVPPKTTHR